MSDANLASLAYAVETTLGIAPTSLKSVRYTGESLSLEKETVSSAEIRSDRQVSDMAKVASQPAGGFEYELSYEFILPFMAAALHNEWTTFSVTAPVAINHTDQKLTGASGSMDGIPVGALVKVSGATTEANNGLKRVIGKAANGSHLIFSPASFTASDVSANLTMTGKTITNGINRKSMTFEKRIVNATGVDFFQRFLGMTVDGMEIKIESKKLITGSVTMVGTTYEIADTGIDTGASTLTRAGFSMTSILDPVENETITIGGVTYRFTADPTIAGDVDTGLGLLDAINNLSAAINGNSLNAPNPVFSSAYVGPNDYAVTAIVAGALANSSLPTDGTFAGISIIYVTQGQDGETGYTEAPSGEVMNGTNNMGVITMDGTTATDRFKSITLQIANNVRGKDACGFEGNWDIGLGQLKVTGVLNAYFRDNSLPTKIKNHTTFSLGFSVEDSTGNQLHFYLPSVKPAKGDPKITGINTDVMIETQYEAILGTSTQNPIGQTIIVDAIAAP